MHRIPGFPPFVAGRHVRLDIAHRTADISRTPGHGLTPAAGRTAGLNHMPDTIDIDRALNAAIALHTARDLDGAEALYRQVLRADPDNAEALNLFGVILQDKGRLEESVELLGQVLRREPDYVEAVANLARGLNLMKQPDMARIASQRAIELDPDLADGWLQLGFARLALGEYAGAIAALRTASVTYPDSEDLHAGLAAAAAALEDHVTAEQAWGQVLRLRPGAINALIGRGAALSSLERQDEALALHRQAIDLDPYNAEAQRALAVTLSRRREPYEVIAFCREVLAGDPDNIDIMLIVASAYSMIGQFEEARVLCRQVLTLDPDRIEAKRRLALLTGEAVGEDATEALETHFEDPARPLAERLGAAFVVARNKERSDDIDGAFDLYRRANDLAHAAAAEAGKSFDPTLLPRYLAWARRVFTPRLFADMRPSANQSEQPVFIVGMPRSGTSLVEQILASHPRIHGAGERKEFSFLIERIKSGLPDDASPAAWDPARIHSEAAGYLEFLDRQSGGAVRVIDKLPDNILLIGQIFILFPRARVIVCRRDPRDVCLSCFVTNFTDGVSWSHRLEDCATRAVQIEELTRFWLSAPPGPIMEVSYEHLVANLETESRRLVDFLGVEWDPACLDFHKTERPVATASFWQVRQPLYSSSVGRWRRFEAHLEPMLRILRDYCPD